MNRLFSEVLRTPSLGTWGKPLEGSSLAGKQDMGLRLPHCQSEWASRSKVGSPGEGDNLSFPPPPPPPPRAPLPQGQDGVAAL